MCLTRRRFVCAVLAGSSLANSALGDDQSTWLNYAIDLETFRPKTPLLDRLKLIGESNFKQFEFGRFKTKDYLALNKVCQELELKPVRFFVETGIIDPKRKASFLQSLEDALEVAELLGVQQLVVGTGEKIASVDDDRQRDSLLDTLEAGIEIIKDVEITLLVDPMVRKGDPKRRIATDLKSAAELFEELKSSKLRLLVDFENGWKLDSTFVSQIKQHSQSIGALRLGSDRLKEGSKTANLEPVDLLRLIHEVNQNSSLGIEFSPRADPVEFLARLQKMDKLARP